MSDSATLPVRARFLTAPSKPVIATDGFGSQSTVSLILSVSNASRAVKVAVPSDTHDSVPLLEREYVVTPNSVSTINAPCDSRSDTPPELDHHSRNELRLLFAEPVTTNDVPSVIEQANASSNPDGVGASTHDPPDDTETEIPVTFAPAHRGNTPTTPAAASTNSTQRPTSTRPLTRRPPTTSPTQS